MAGNKSRNAPPPQKPNWALIGGLGALATVLIVVVVALLGSRGSSQAGSSPAAGAPQVSVSETEIDHGTQRFETPVESVFTVSNTGDAPLNILGEPRVELIEGC